MQKVKGNDRFNLKVPLEKNSRSVWELRYNSLAILEGSYYLDVGLRRSWISPLHYDKKPTIFNFVVTSKINQGGGISSMPHRWVNMD